MSMSSRAGGSRASDEDGRTAVKVGTCITTPSRHLRLGGGLKSLPSLFWGEGGRGKKKKKKKEKKRKKKKKEEEKSPFQS